LPVNFVLNNSGAGNGEFTVAAPIPNDPGLVGLDVYVQAIIADAGGPKGFSATRGMHFRVCQ
jgi:hypothetical protein